MEQEIAFSKKAVNFYFVWFVFTQ